MKIPDKCKDCIYLKLYKDYVNCMLTHPLNLANGCPNKKKDQYI